ncbi:glucose 1-dehydrogenase [Planctomicrobium sp. SH664]|uniref:glucose 1-dehydrogenase n=1 Tax=Planctomicrobium sp. SH664 TaxID=3448125 RepID=UPI003F5BCCB2
MSELLAGQVAVVTGASKGIGAEIARELAAAGAAVVVNYASDKAGADKAVAAIQKAGGKGIAVQGSVSSIPDMARLFATAEQNFGKVDTLVNNAGVYEFQPIEELTTESFRKMFDTNVLGLLLATQAALRHFNPKGGSIVNIGSVVSTAAPPQGSIYNGTKGAVDSITRTLANELGSRQIRVNSVNPGMVETEGTHSLGFIGSELHQNFIATAPLGRSGLPRDIAPAVAFLASPGASWITGQLLNITGGFR